MRYADALAYILVILLFSLPVVEAEESLLSRPMPADGIVIPPSSGPVRKKTRQRQRVLDLNTVQLVEYEESAPEDVSDNEIRITPKTSQVVRIDEFLEGKEIQEPRIFPTVSPQNIDNAESGTEKWQQPIMKVNPDWSTTQKSEVAGDLEYQAPRQEDVWESSSESESFFENAVKSASVSHPQQVVAPPPPPLEDDFEEEAGEYNPMPNSLPMPDGHSNSVWQPIDSITEESLSHYSENYYQPSPSIAVECQTCWQEEEVWVEEGDFQSATVFSSVDQAGISPVLIFGAKGGNDRSLGEVQAIMPLWQNDLDLLFGDIQGRFSDSEENEGHFGLGFRTYLNDEWLIGSYAYYDLRKTFARNRFNQLTIGLELLSEIWDFRVNGYFPNEGYKNSQFMSGISNGTIITNNFRERAYRGYNIEIGRRILRWGRFDTNEFRWFIGYYSFDSRASGFRKIDGPRMRVEYRNYDLPFLGPQARLTAGFEYSNDNLREDQYWGYLRFQIPLSPRAHRTPLDPLRRRFMDPTSRGID